MTKKKKTFANRIQEIAQYLEENFTGFAKFQEKHVWVHSKTMWTEGVVRGFIKKDHMTYLLKVHTHEEGTKSKNWSTKFLNVPYFTEHFS